MMEDELVSEKDVLVLQTGFLKGFMNYIRFHLRVLIKKITPRSKKGSLIVRFFQKIVETEERSQNTLPDTKEIGKLRTQRSYPQLTLSSTTVPESQKLKNDQLARV